MNLRQLRDLFREEAHDTIGKPLWTDPWINGRLNEAQNEAAVRGRLLLEVDKPAVCRVPLRAGQASCMLHPALFEITYLAFVPTTGAAEPQPLQLVSSEWLDRHHAGWRTRRFDRMAWAIQHERSLRLAPAALRDGHLVLEGYRLPLEAMCSDNDEPEIHAFGHEKLVQWVLYRAFSQPDVEGADLPRAALAEQEFTRFFGLRPDADLRRQTREDQHQVTESIIL